MSIKVLMLAFEKAGREIGSKKKTHRAQHLSDILLENYNYTINERTLRDYYSGYINGTIGLQNDLKSKLLVCLCKYLEYKDYADFLNQNQTDTPPKEPKKKKRKWILTISISIVFGASILIPSIFENGPVLNTISCMTWVKTHYEEISCATKYSANVEPLDPIKLTNFRKVEVTMATDFFSEETNKPLIWYYKNKNGEIEYFTAPGLHPINGKTLKAITDHIINTYVPIHSYHANSFVE
ncbi:hypothetical protein [Spongiimicrobium salis]|uniref:hypothetical protein n=1 Tax=Spongiimicrobium salis TaxID=1667022 RepID=UPI00374D7299